MAIRTIRQKNDEVLRKIAKPVEEITDRVLTLVEDMVETMYEADGVGLAAPQVGILKRIAVIDIYDETGVKVLINPEIMRTEGEQQDVEGCLSVPGESGEVVRPQSLTVKALGIDGKEYTMEAEGLLARVVCHELDHLDGVLFTDKVTDKATEA